MRILFLTSAHNSLSQRLFVELTERGHEIRVSVVANGEEMIEAAEQHAPDLIIAPMLKIAIPPEVYTRTQMFDCAPWHQRRPRTIVARLGDNERRKGMGRHHPGSR